METPDDTFDAGTEINLVLPAWVRIRAMDVDPAGPPVNVAAFKGIVVIPEGLIVTFSPVEPAERVGPVVPGEIKSVIVRTDG